MAAAGAALVALAGAMALPAASSASTARQGAPAAPAGVVDPTSSMLAKQPIDTAVARQLLTRLREGTVPATEDEVVGLAEELDGGAAARDLAVVQLRSNPLRGDRIEDAYQRFLDRDADPSGLDHWGRKVQAGTIIEEVERSLATSAEMWRRAGSTNDGLVDLVYVAVFGAPADPSGHAYWVGRLDGGTSRASFVRSLLRSSQRANRLVGDAYVRYLGRAADPGGKASKVDQYTTARIDEFGLIAGLVGSGEARRSGCDALDPRLCLLPFPNDRFTVADATTPTGRRVAFKREWMPRNAQGVAINPQEWNRNDGFSVGQAALLQVPGIDLAETGAAPLDDVGASLDAEAPILVIDADTGERHPVFVELDANIAAEDQAVDQLMYVRPATNYVAGHRYIVALRDLKRSDGSTIEAPTSFTFYRDGDTGAGVGDVEARRPHMDQIFSDLASAGVAKDDLYLAWDFTVASVGNTTGRMLHIRDQAFDSLGGAAPTFEVTSSVPNPREGVASRIEGTFEVPLYLTGVGAAGEGYANDGAGIPRRNGSFTARFGCELPTLAEGQTARSVIYGHGLFGDFGEVRSGPQAAMVRDHDYAYCATDWIGMSEDDIGNAGTILQDLSTFNTLPDRSQQGILNTAFLGRLMVTNDGFVSDPAFQINGGDPVLDTSALFYDGNSQGGVIGGALVAVSPDVQAGVLGVFGMNYSTLLERSVDFDPFSQLMRVTYPSAPDRVLGLQLIQMLWDRGETNGYAAHLTDDPLPGSGANRVLIHTALGDHQVATFTAEVAARTAGGFAIHRPVYAPGRSSDVEAGWGLPSLTYPSTGSGLVLWDSGAALAPLTNVPPRTGEDPHGDPRNSADAQQQKADFLRVDGTITDACGPDPCTAPAT